MSFQLLIIILMGMALELYENQPELDKDPYQKAGFDAFIVAMTVLVTVCSLFAVFAAIPCIRDFIMDKFCGGDPNDWGAQEEGDDNAADHAEKGGK